MDVPVCNVLLNNDIAQRCHHLQHRTLVVQCTRSWCLLLRRCACLQRSPQQRHYTKTSPLATQNPCGAVPHKAGVYFYVKRLSATFSSTTTLHEDVTHVQHGTLAVQCTRSWCHKKQCHKKLVPQEASATKSLCHKKLVPQKAGATKSIATKS